MKVSFKNIALQIFMAFFLLSEGCVSHHPADSTVKFADILKAYPKTLAPLSIRKIDSPLLGLPYARPVPVDVSIIVHPAYAIFIDEELEEEYSDVKYGLLKKQFENEAKFIHDQARQGNVVVLVLPAGSVPESGKPSSYVTYLNKTTLGKDSVYYVFSETRESGNLTPNDVALLRGFLQAARARKLLIGGGYIGRCQGELYGQVETYTANEIYIVPEISTISPEDISEDEASSLFNSMQRQDYAPVKEFIVRKTQGDIHLLSVPQVRQ